MEPTSSYRPRVSRETRLLLMTGLLAITALWLLARVRFPDRPSAPNPLPAVLGQLNAGFELDDVAAAVGALQTRLTPSLVTIEPPSHGHAAPRQTERIVGLRYREGLAVALLPARSLYDAPGVIAVDPASGVALLRAPGQAPTAPPIPWAPREPRRPRYLVATDVSAAGTSLRPAFVGSFDAIANALWADPVWAVPTGSDLSPGSIVFTSDAELVGLVITHDEQRVIVPAATLLAEADRLLAHRPGPAGTVGIEVQPLTPALASSTGGSVGVVVAWVDTAGAATGHVKVGDVIESVDGRPLTGRGSWDVRMARLSAGDTVSVRGRSRRGVLQASLVALPTRPPATPTIGLALLSRPRTGAEVTRVLRGSAGERAGLVVGDLITVFGEILAPTPTQVRRSFASMSQGQGVIVGVTRGDAHLVTVLER
ncbi:MAG: PDZ domain-containing protein [Vicinamibacteraceae bacterium]